MKIGFWKQDYFGVKDFFLKFWPLKWKLNDTGENVQSGRKYFRLGAESYSSLGRVEKKRKENSLSTFGRFRLRTSFESSPVSVKMDSTIIMKCSWFRNSLFQIDFQQNRLHSRFDSWLYSDCEGVKWKNLLIQSDFDYNFPLVFSALLHLPLNSQVFLFFSSVPHFREKFLNFFQRRRPVDCLSLKLLQWRPNLSFLKNWYFENFK